MSTTFEDNLQANMFNGNSEKTFIDKLLARQDIEATKKLIKKDKLKRTELLELLYMVSSSESKLFNLGEWDRYLLLKFFVWIREFIKVCELLFDYEDTLEKKQNFHLSDRARKQLDHVELLIQHNAKFLIDLYFNIGRTSLSVGGTAFIEMLKNKYEIAYPQVQGNQQVQTAQQQNMRMRS